MKYKLIIAMDNRCRYEYCETFKINNADGFSKVIKDSGFLKSKNINDKNYVLFGAIDGANVIVSEDKISSFEFIPISD